MLYLAEVQNSGRLRGRRSLLKLLMRLESGLVWSPLAEETIVAASQINRPYPGLLVLVELDSSQRIGQIQEATPVLLKTLQNLSLLQAKLRHQQAEIEEWKNSLIYQAQILSKRTAEFEKRLQELRQLDGYQNPDRLKLLEYEYDTLQVQQLEVSGGRQKMQNLETEVASFVQQLHEELTELQLPNH